MAILKFHCHLIPFTYSEKLRILKISYQTTMCSMPYILLHIFANSNSNFAFIFYKLTPWCRVHPIS